MELHLTARQTGLWQRLLALTRDQLMGLSMQIESTGQVDSEMLTTLAQQFGLDEPLPNDRLSQRVLCTLALAQSSAGLAQIFASNWQVEDVVLTFGTPQQRQRYFTQQRIFGLATLPSQVTTSSTVTATPVTAGWRLSGTVKAVLNVAQATDYLILAQTPSDAMGTFMVAADQPGVTVGSQVIPLGLHGLAMADIQLTSVPVTAAEQFGQLGRGQQVMQRAQSLGQLFAGAITAGIWQHATDQTRQLTLTEQPPLADLSPVLALTAALQTSVFNAAQQADDERSFTNAAQLAALFASQNALTPFEKLMPLMGELAYTQHSPLVALRNDVATLPLIVGTTAQLALTFAATSLNDEDADVPTTGGRTVPEHLVVADLHRVVKRLNLTKDVPVNVGSIATAKRIVALGRGAMEPAVLLQAQQLAKWIGAAIAVTQPLTAMEQFSIEQQVGAMAVTVAPEVLINIGVAGDDDYLAGMAGAQHVLSVNVDEQAPIFNHSQQIFVGAAAEFLAGMVAALN
ncbi:FAD-binding protein [Lactiplantibacillus paraplantarum]|uniref:FAD-binding protein n=1 Tax=Lactiplantibacillus paraplantarum TaxID=60520 RepID=UPI00051485B4|nr:FAD-binding protein [Lactiplantibacillus paraplantarum]OAX74162.1 acyl-CoA dehydrogenase [Lactiplantibacillus plantarum]ALO03490.1 acyl-CoA dehydrogenase [Lactiplantibacillus paraplantarum]KGE75614.1 acyl-CoA dehydrogenase [Lactiplantibacillus paraplantarum]MCW1909011.1 FAD-binding protein [Lactiplantibacillus paraplantarum]RDG11974.1 acyl-CoA dehydrogenase [Lactiplantibacillus paraplantarum]